MSLESLEELPADDIEIIEGDEEGVRRYHRWGPKEILRDEAGRVSAAVFKRVTRVFDEAGRFAPVFIEDETMTLEADTVLWAIGQRPDLSFVPSDSDIKRNERGLIACNPQDLTTSAPDVFLAGDIAYGTRLLIDAVASGKNVARSVHRYLTGHAIEASQMTLHLSAPTQQREADYEKQRRVPLPVLDPKQRVASHDQVVESGYTPSMACCEAGRCLDCGVNTIFDSDKCILCGGCADVCPELCLRLVSVSSLDGGAELAPLLEARYEADELAEASAIIKDESRCIRCALCAQRCPVGAITMEQMTFSDTWEQVTV